MAFNLAKHSKKLDKTLAKQAQAQTQAITQARSHTTAMRNALAQAILDYSKAVAHEHAVITKVNSFLASQRTIGWTESEIARQQDVIVDVAGETLDLIDEYVNNNDMVDLDDCDDLIDSLDEGDTDGEVVE